MKKIYSITRRYNSNEVKASDVHGRSERLSAGEGFVVGDRIVVKNGIVVGKVKKTKINRVEV